MLLCSFKVCAQTQLPRSYARSDRASNRKCQAASGFRFKQYQLTRNKIKVYISKYFILKWNFVEHATNNLFSIPNSRNASSYSTQSMIWTFCQKPLQHLGLFQKENRRNFGHGFGLKKCSVYKLTYQLEKLITFWQKKIDRGTPQKSVLRFVSDQFPFLL